MNTISSAMQTTQKFQWFDRSLVLFNLRMYKSTQQRFHLYVVHVLNYVSIFTRFGILVLQKEKNIPLGNNFK